MNKLARKYMHLFDLYFLLFYFPPEILEKIILYAFSTRITLHAKLSRKVPTVYPRANYGRLCKQFYMSQWFRPRILRDCTARLDWGRSWYQPMSVYYDVVYSSRYVFPRKKVNNQYLDKQMQYQNAELCKKHSSYVPGFDLNKAIRDLDDYPSNLDLPRRRSLFYWTYDGRVGLAHWHGMTHEQVTVIVNCMHARKWFYNQQMKLHEEKKKHIANWNRIVRNSRHINVGMTASFELPRIA